MTPPIVAMPTLFRRRRAGGLCLAFSASVAFVGDGRAQQAPAPAPTAAPAPGSPSSNADADLIVAARVAAESWLVRVDAGEYGRSWQESAPYFRQTVDEAKWTELLGSVRLPFGKAAGRRLLVSRFSAKMPGIPDGAYVFLQFQTEFPEPKKTAVETLVCLRDVDGRWKVAGYYVK